MGLILSNTAAFSYFPGVSWLTLALIIFKSNFFEPKGQLLSTFRFRVTSFCRAYPYEYRGFNLCHWIYPFPSTININLSNIFGNYVQSYLRWIWLYNNFLFYRIKSYPLIIINNDGFKLKCNSEENLNVNLCAKNLFLTILLK